MGKALTKVRKNVPYTFEIKSHLYAATDGLAESLQNLAWTEMSSGWLESTCENKSKSKLQ